MVAAVVLAGGRARRLGGADKPGLLLHGRPLLDHVLTALPGVDPVVVVGPARPCVREVRWCVEQPPGGGPVAALAAGLAALGDGQGLVAVLAADLAGLRADTVTRLVDELTARPDVAGAVLVDGDGRTQWLLGVWRTAALVLPRQPAGAALRGVLGALPIHLVAARPGEARDVDTSEDLERARAGEPSQPSHP